MLPVVILAGGLGTRLVEITGDAVPKVLVPVAGRPFISWKLEDLAVQGVTDVLLLVGHHADAIQEYVGDGSAFGLQVRCLDDGDTLRGTGGAIRRALPQLPNSFWVTYGDSLLDVDLAVAESAFAHSGLPGLMTVWHNREALGPSNALVRGGLVVEYAKRPPPEGAEHIDYGMLILTASSLDGQPDDEAFDLGEVLSALAADAELGALEVHDRFYDIGDPEALQATEAHLQLRRS